MLEKTEVLLLNSVRWEMAGIRSLQALFDSGLLEDIPLRVTVVSPDCRYLYLNSSMLAFLSARAEDLIGRTVAEVWGDETQARFCGQRFYEALTGQALSQTGWREYPKSLSKGRGYIQDVFIPFRVSDGPVQAIVIFVRDHTQLRLREAELIEKEDKLRASEAHKSAIFDHAMAALVSIDEGGYIAEFNPAAEAMFGRSREDVIGCAFSEILIPERFRADHNTRVASMKVSAKTPRLDRHLQLYALHANGTEFPIEMTLWCTRVAGTAFYTVSMVDLTERWNAAQQIERQREALRHSEKLSAMGSLLAGVAHELNNPLAIAMGRASLLEEKCNDAALKEDARRIRDATERCGRIVRTFLNMARGKPAQHNAVNLNEIVQGALDMLGYTLRTHGIELNTELAEIPPVTADADQISQVIVNLLVNAQQALDSVQFIRRIFVRTGISEASSPTARRVWLQVCDNGPGVPEEARSNLFEPFFTTKPEGVGTGLGLSVSRSLARSHGGELTLEPRGEDALTTFCLSLPVSEATVSIEWKSASSLTPLNQVGVGTLARVLVVDDEPEIAAVMREMLMWAGYEVAIAESAPVAMKLLRTAHFGAIVADLRMPEMDGSALWREITIHYPALATRTLFVTGDTLSSDARHFLDATGCMTLDKPFSKAQLLSRVAQIIN